MFAFFHLANICLALPFFFRLSCSGARATLVGDVAKVAVLRRANLRLLKCTCRPLLTMRWKMQEVVRLCRRSSVVRHSLKTVSF